MTSLRYNLPEKKSKKSNTHFILYLFSKKVIPLIYARNLLPMYEDFILTTEMNSTAKTEYVRPFGYKSHTCDLPLKY